MYSVSKQTGVCLKFPAPVVRSLVNLVKYFAFDYLSAACCTWRVCLAVLLGTTLAAPAFSLKAAGVLTALLEWLLQCARASCNNLSKSLGVDSLPVLEPQSRALLWCTAGLQKSFFNIFSFWVRREDTGKQTLCIESVAVLRVG